MKKGGRLSRVLKSILLVLTILFFVTSFAYIGIKGYGFLRDFKLGSVTEEVVSLGEGTYQEVDYSKVITSEKYGQIPVNQLGILLDSDLSKADAEKIAEEIDASVVGELEMINLYQLEIKATTEEELEVTLETLKEMDGVEQVITNKLLTVSKIVGKSCKPYNDETYNDPTNSGAYDVIGMPNAWKLIKASGLDLNDVNVGVVDTALYSGSTELGGVTRIDGDTQDAPDTKADGSLKCDGLTHGTMVTHVIGADPGNNGVVGIASVLGDKLNIKVKNLFDNNPDYVAADANSDADTTVTYGNNQTDVIKTLVYLKEQVEAGSKVINCSFGNSSNKTDYPEIAAAYTKFFNKIKQEHPDVVFVAAAGNNAREYGALNGVNDFPAGLPLSNVVTVGALNLDGTSADFSNYATIGGEVTISAPGVDIMMGVDADGNPVKNSGTSFSAPMVTAAIALMKSINPDLSADEIKGLLIQTSSSTVGTTTIDPTLGGGILNLEGLLLQVINDKRRTLGLDELNLEDYYKQMQVDLVADGGADKFDVVASVPAIAKTSTNLTIITQGDCEVTGDEQQSVAEGDQAAWEIEITGDEPVVIHVSREDTGACSNLTLQGGELEGTWDTDITITSDNLSPLLAKAIGEMVDDALNDMGCEKGSDGKVKIETKGKSQFVITKTDETGKNYALTIKPYEEQKGNVVDIAESLGALTGSVDDNGEVSFTLIKSDQDVTIYLTFNVELSGKDQIDGIFEIYLEGKIENVQFGPSAKVLGIFTGTRNMSQETETTETGN